MKPIIKKLKCGVIQKVHVHKSTATKLETDVARSILVRSWVVHQSICFVNVFFKNGTFVTSD